MTVMVNMKWTSLTAHITYRNSDKTGHFTDECLLLTSRLLVLKTKYTQIISIRRFSFSKKAATFWIYTSPVTSGFLSRCFWHHWAFKHNRRVFFFLLILRLTLCETLKLSVCYWFRNSALSGMLAKDSFGCACQIAVWGVSSFCRFTQISV